VAAGFVVCSGVCVVGGVVKCVAIFLVAGGMCVEVLAVCSCACVVCGGVGEVSVGHGLGSEVVCVFAYAFGFVLLFASKIVSKVAGLFCVVV